MSMTELFRDGAQLSLPVPADTAAGSPVLVGVLTGVTLTTEGEGGNADGYATVSMPPSPVHNVTVTGAVTAIGQAIYIVAADNSLTVTASTNKLYGAALALKDATASVIPVKLV